MSLSWVTPFAEHFTVYLLNRRVGLTPGVTMTDLAADYAGATFGFYQAVLGRNSIDDEGMVKDEASPALRKIRRDLRGAEGELVALLERHMARLDAHQRVPDMSVTVRNGRYVIPIRREARGAIGGIVHDESATKNTLFVEPPAAIEFGNRIRELEAEEAREVLRVLRELTDAIRPLREPMAAALEAFGHSRSDLHVVPSNRYRNPAALPASEGSLLQRVLRGAVTPGARRNESGGFVQNRQGYSQTNVDGQQVTTIYHSGGDNEQPQWSRDAIGEFQVVANFVGSTAYDNGRWAVVRGR